MFVCISAKPIRAGQGPLVAGGAVRPLQQPDNKRKSIIIGGNRGELVIQSPELIFTASLIPVAYTRIVQELNIFVILKIRKYLFFIILPITIYSFVLQLDRRLKSGQMLLQMNRRWKSCH